ncbi:MAG: von Willebrand factor type A domain-containing protein [Planctomycetes bacterium]|nr:von Willebrand factor type A domain-containing protein [Planctomycetota bacterium]
MDVGHRPKQPGAGDAKTSDSERPSDRFTQDLIDQAMGNLQSAALPSDSQASIVRKRAFKAIAACLVILMSLTAMISLLLKYSETPGNTPTGYAHRKPTKPELVELAFVLPRPMFVGTPMNMKLSVKLEKPRGHARPAFYAPKGTVNVAINKPVTSSDPLPIIGELAMITDGDKEAADGSYVELGPFLQHVTVDLQDEFDIYAILFWHYHKQARVYFDVIVQVSTDPDFINAKTLYNNDVDSSAGLGVGSDLHYIETHEGRLIDAKGIRARYVRIYSNGNTSNDLNNFIEIEVWARPPLDDDKQPDTSKESKKPQPETTPLPIKLPRPMFVGTPMNMKLGGRRTRTPFYPAAEPMQYRMAHGGTTPPNAQAYDAMFFKNYGVNPFVDTDDDHLSTFATDVDTGSFTVCRRYLLDGNLPPDKAVRVEEFVNYFDYGYAAPQEETFSVYTEAAPWSEWTGRQNSYLVRFGLKAMEVSDANRKPAILTFVIDVSGSMNRENRLGLVKKSLRMLVKRLRPKDKIGIAVYGSQGRKVLDHVNVKKKKKILAAIDSLQAGGSTFAEQGIRIGYDMAGAAYKKGCINRVILCSDGVANVGRTGHEQIMEVIKDKADKGITLSSLGFGMGNYNDVLLERLGDKGNGYYAYIDTIDEAKRLFDGNLTGALQVVARDVKIQVDFNPKVVRSYRLIGYENRDVADNKFRDDKEDGGEMGAGHSATALYEIKLWQDKTGPVATTYIRYKDPDTREVTEFNSTIATTDFHKSFEQASDAFALAAAVTEFAEVLRKSYWAKDKTLDDILQQAQQLGRKFEDKEDVTELVDLISRAKKITPPPASDKHTDKNEDDFIAP